MKETLLAAARDLDRGQVEAAVARLGDEPLSVCEQPLRIVALALWKRIFSATVTDAGKLRELFADLKIFEAAIVQPAYIWNVYQKLRGLEEVVGAERLSALVATTLWHRTVEANEVFFNIVFETFYRGGGKRCGEAWDQYLSAHADFIPTYWQFGLLTKTFPATSHAEIAGIARKSLSRIGREDLAPLYEVYLMQMRQAPAAEIMAAARKLASPEHRARIASYLTSMGFMPDEMKTAVTHYAELAGDKPGSRESIALMQSRLAGSERRWKDAVDDALMARAEPEFRDPADVVRANALARLGNFSEAIEILERIVNDKDASPFLQSRATFVRVTVEALKAGRTPAEDGVLKPFPELPGRPLAQSLWVGKKLRWIERLAIKSYLNNGWRFQLYVYDDPDNVPEGCEVLDASAIIPAREVFREGAGSGVHAGSVGAFSDLFRYRMLYERGGMWTDTDIINFRKFDPDGQRFVATEISDAGLVTLNGAMMAAPAGDLFQKLAYERAAKILSGERMFFTRVGPYLLAELVNELGPDSMPLMPPSFLSPVYWMNTGSLLEPYEKVMAKPEFKNAMNVHVYTEMWRTLGLGLDRPPPKSTFLGRLYAEHFEDFEPAREAALA